MKLRLYYNHINEYLYLVYGDTVEVSSSNGSYINDGWGISTFTAREVKSLFYFEYLGSL
jgi:hypothetical protein